MARYVYSDIDKTITSSLRFLSEGTIRNATAVVKQVITNLTEGRLESQRIKLEFAGEGSSAKASSALSSALFGTSLRRSSEKTEHFDLQEQSFGSSSSIDDSYIQKSQSTNPLLTRKRQIGPVSLSADSMTITDLDPRHRGPITALKKHK